MAREVRNLKKDRKRFKPSFPLKPDVGIVLVAGTKKEATTPGMRKVLVNYVKVGNKVVKTEDINLVWGGTLKRKQPGLPMVEAREIIRGLAKAVSGTTKFSGLAPSGDKMVAEIVTADFYLGGKKELTIKTPLETEGDYIRLIRKGIRKKSVDHLIGATNITVGEMAEIMETTAKEFAAIKPGALMEKSQSEKAVNIARLYAMGEEVFGSVGEFANWMNGRVPSLGKKRPKDFLDTSSGINLLMDEIARIQHGVYS